MALANCGPHCGTRGDDGGGAQRSEAVMQPRQAVPGISTALPLKAQAFIPICQCHRGSSRSASRSKVILILASGAGGVDA